MRARLDKILLREGERNEGISSNLSLFELIDITRKNKSKNDGISSIPFKSLIFHLPNREDLRGKVNHSNKERISKSRKFERKS